MPPTATEQHKMHLSNAGKSEAKPTSYNNNVIAESDISECSTTGTTMLPGEQDIVQFWPYTCSQQSCGTNLLRITGSKLEGKDVKGYHVDFRGCAYNKKHPKKNLKSELQWTPHVCEDSGVMLYMHDPANLKADEFPYVLSTYTYQDKVIPCAIDRNHVMETNTFSTVFKIICVPWGQSTLYVINDYSNVTSYISRSPDGDAIITKTDRPPFYNPLSYMLISDQGPPN